jgi:hypothetical protein
VARLRSDDDTQRHKRCGNSDCERSGQHGKDWAAQEGENTEEEGVVLDGARERDEREEIDERELMI